ncbi:hypothetical protein VPH35_097603 [Triticum aestivum]
MASVVPFEGDGAPDPVLPVLPGDVAELPRAGRPRLRLRLAAELHAVAPLLLRPPELQRRRRHGHLHPVGRRDRHVVALGARRHQGQRPRQCADAGAAVEHHHERRVVEVGHAAGDRPRALAQLRHEHPHLLHRVVECAEEVDVVLRAGVVHQARVHGEPREHEPGPGRQRRRAHDDGADGTAAVHDVPAVLVERAGGRHQRRTDHGRRPVAVPLLDQGRHAGHVRARHRRPGEDVVLHSPGVHLGVRWRGGT